MAREGLEKVGALHQRQSGKGQPQQLVPILQEHPTEDAQAMRFVLSAHALAEHGDELFHLLHVQVGAIRVHLGQVEGDEPLEEVWPCAILHGIEGDVLKLINLLALQLRDIHISAMLLMRISRKVSVVMAAWAPGVSITRRVVPASLHDTSFSASARAVLTALARTSLQGLLAAPMEMTVASESPLHRSESELLRR